MQTPTATPQTANKEEYLQAIWTLADEAGAVIAARIAEFLHVTPASVSEMVHRLERDGLLALGERKEIALTPAGEELARSVVRRHRIIERFLVDVLGYEWWKTHEEAERLEHALSPEMESRMASVLGNPDACPHGNPMPGMPARPTRPLGAVPSGEEAVVERIPDQFEHEPGFLQYLDAQGIRPGVRVTVRESVPGRLRVEIAGTPREIRPDCAQKVWVRR